MGGTGPCDSIKIIFAYHVNSWHIILNIKYGVNQMLHVVKTPEYRFDLYGVTKSHFCLILFLEKLLSLSIVIILLILYLLIFE